MFGSVPTHDEYRVIGNHPHRDILASRTYDGREFADIVARGWTKDGYDCKVETRSVTDWA